MTSFYESATSGLNYDRFFGVNGERRNANINDDFFNDSRFGKKEDAFLLASDAKFDTKLSLYLAISNTTKRLLSAIEDYHHYTEELLDYEVDLAYFLNQESTDEKKHLQKVMQISSRCLDVASKQREKTIKPLICMYHDLDIFYERAIADCQSTVEAAKHAQIEYRGSLLWIKSVSEELDPSSSAQIENYRKTQTVVRLNKEKFDALKSDTFQKVNVLAQCRSSLLINLARQLLDAVGMFYANSVRTSKIIFDELNGIDSYEIDVLKILNDPIGLALERQKQTVNPKINKQLQMYNAKLSQQKRRMSPTSLQTTDNKQRNQIGNNIFELEDIKLSQIGTDTSDFMTKNYIIVEPSPSTSNLINLENANDQKLDGLICSSTALFRADSPLGILDDQEEKVNYRTDPLMLSSKNSNYIFKTHTINEVNSINAFGKTRMTPKLEQPSSLTPRKTRNTKLAKPNDINWSNILAQELDEALNFGTTKNSYSLM